MIEGFFNRKKIIGSELRPISKKHIDNPYWRGMVRWRIFAFATSQIGGWACHALIGCLCSALPQLRIGNSADFTKRESKRNTSTVKFLFYQG